MVSSQQRGVGFSIMPRNLKKKMCQTYKVIVLGGSGVGKSRLLRRMTDSDSLLTNDEIHKDYLSKMAIVEGAPAPVKVQLWDTAGQEKFGAAQLPSSFFRHADAAIVVYDVTDRPGFASVLGWVLQIQAYQSAAVVDSSFSLILVGHKCDVSNAIRQVHEEEGREIAKLIGASHFFECSSEDGTNVQACFDAVAAALANGTPWSLSDVPLSCIESDLALSDSLAKIRRLAAARSCSNLDVSAPTPNAASLAVLSPTLRALSTKPDLSVVGAPYIGTLAALLSMPMVLLWLDDDAVLRWAEAMGILQ